MSQRRQPADVFNTFYRIPTPEDAPLRAGLGDFYRFKTFPICQKCDHPWPRKYPLILQIPKFVEVGGVLVAGPGITDERVMEQFMVNACNKGVGCWRECTCGKNWNMVCPEQCHLRADRTDASGFGPARPGDCMHICTCNPGCGNQKKYPCQCGYTKLFHEKDCPVGLFKRDSSFLTAYMRARMMKRGVRVMMGSGVRL